MVGREGRCLEERGSPFWDICQSRYFKLSLFCLVNKGNGPSQFFLFPLNMPKLKILCLHGLAENAIYMRKKTESMMRSVEDMVDLGNRKWRMDRVRSNCPQYHSVHEWSLSSTPG
jgi:hypothetical protein